MTQQQIAPTKSAPDYRLVVGEDERVIQWICQQAGNTMTSPVGCTSIGLTCDDELVAGVYYDHYMRRSIHMHVAIGRKGMTYRPFLRFVFRFPFEELKVSKIIGTVPEHNLQTHTFVQHVGFRRETVISDCVDDPGDQGRTGMVIYEMRRSDCRFL